MYPRGSGASAGAVLTLRLSATFSRHGGYNGSVKTDRQRVGAYDSRRFLARDATADAATLSRDSAVDGSDAATATVVVVDNKAAVEDEIAANTPRARTAARERHDSLNLFA